MIFELFSMAFHALWGNKLRSTLSILGIIIGVSTVIAVFGIGLGAQKKVADQFKNLSVTTLTVFPKRGSSFSSRLSDTDVSHVLENSSTIQSGSAIIRGTTTVTSTVAESSYTLMGTSFNFFEETNLPFLYGETFGKNEEPLSKKIILGNTVASELFLGMDLSQVIGESVSLAGKKFTVAGILEKNGKAMSMISFDDSVFIPFDTAKQTILGTKGQSTLFFKAKSVDSLAIAQVELTSLLREAHRLKTSQDDDFRIMDAGSMVSSAQESSKTLTYLLTGVATIVLLVSGIGIMNVMFVTVAERTKEIGVLKAIGAKQKDILIQFLMEAVVLSLFGGLVGIGLGTGIIPFLSSLGAVHSSEGVLIGFSFSALVGIFFGFYPALKASKLDPVDALRSE